MSQQLFTTERLIVRPWESDDLEAAWAIYGDPVVMRYVGDGTPHADRDQTRTWLQRRIEQRADPSGLGGWAVVERETSEVVGTSLLFPFLDTGDVEVAYQFRQSAWGKGHATEVTRAAIAYGFDVLKLPRIVGVVYPENIASQRVLEKAGLNRRGTFPYRGLLPFYYILESPGAGQE